VQATNSKQRNGDGGIFNFPPVVLLMWGTTFLIKKSSTFQERLAGTSKENVPFNQYLIRLSEN
jgi:hypothetical protein